MSSRAVLIGTAAYEKMTDLPAVTANLADLRDALADEDAWGLPEQHIKIIADEADPNLIYRELRAAATATKPDGLLLFYYAGHGLVDAPDLVLGLPRTDPQFPDEEGLKYSKIRQATRLGVTSSRVVILDCCYAGRAGRDVPSAGDAAREIADRPETENIFLLLAVGPNEPARAPLGDRNTAFTAALLEVLRRGSETGDPVLTIKAIADDATRHLRAAGHAQPQLRMTNSAGEIPLVHNVRVRRRDLTGTVLRAAPEVTDVDLRLSQILVLRHNATGALGVRLNRPGEALPLLLARWHGLMAPPAQVFDGGPIARDGYIALARIRTGTPKPIRFTKVVGTLGSLPLTDSPESLAGRVADLRIFQGYLGWGPGRLEQLVNDEVLLPEVVPAPRATFSSGPWS